MWLARTTQKLSRLISRRCGTDMIESAAHLTTCQQAVQHCYVKRRVDLVSVAWPR